MREDLISRRKVLLLAGLATGLAAPAATVLTASDAEAGFRSAVIIHAANDDEAIAQAEVVRGSFAAELLDIEGLRIVKYLPSTGRRQK
jgi:hypothetical protein